MRLIDADKVIADNAGIIDCEIDHPKYQDTLREIIDSAETVDAVKVVRCKDCKYREECMEKAMCEPEWYCADGIRTDTPRGSAEYGTQETKRIKKIIWEVLHGGYSIDTPVDQDWVSTKIFMLIDGCDEEEADNVADETCK